MMHLPQLMKLEERADDHGGGGGGGGGGGSGGGGGGGGDDDDAREGKGVKNGGRIRRGQNERVRENQWADERGEKSLLPRSFLPLDGGESGVESAGCAGLGQGPHV